MAFVTWISTDRSGRGRWINEARIEHPLSSTTNESFVLKNYLGKMKTWIWEHWSFPCDLRGSHLNDYSGSNPKLNVSLYNSIEILNYVLIIGISAHTCKMNWILPFNHGYQAKKQYKSIVSYPTGCRTFITFHSLGRPMRPDSYPQAMKSFPVLQLITAFFIWILPPVIAAAFLSASVQTSSIVTILILLSLVVSVPLSAYILYRIDLSKNDGCISLWGFRWHH